MIVVSQVLYPKKWVTERGAFVIVPTLERGKRKHHVLYLDLEGLRGVTYGTFRTMREARRALLHAGAEETPERTLCARSAELGWRWADQKTRQWIASVRKGEAGPLTCPDEEERLWRLYLLREGF